MRKLFTLFGFLCSLMLALPAWAWSYKSNEKVTEDISGYYVIKGNMDDEYLTVRSNTADKAFNFYEMTGSFTGTYLATGDGTSLDMGNLDTKYVFQLIRQSDGNYLMRYCGCPYPCYIKVEGSTMTDDRDISVTASPAMASHIRICKITEEGYASYPYYLFDGTYTDEAGMAFCPGSNTNPEYHVYSVTKHATSNWESDCRVNIIKLTDAQIPAAAKAENLKEGFTWDEGTYRIGGFQGSFAYMQLVESFTGGADDHITANLFQQNEFDTANKDKSLFNITSAGDDMYYLYNLAAKGYVVPERLNSDADQWGYTTVSETKTDAAKMILSFDYSDGSIEFRSYGNINHFYDGSKELCVTNGGESKWAKWQLERQFTMGSEGRAFFSLSKSVTIPTGVKAYIIDGVTAGKVKMTEITTVIPANTPVILTAEAGDFYMPLTFTTATVDNNKLHVYTKPVTGTAYIINGNVLKKVDASTLTEGSYYLLDADFGEGVLSDGMEMTMEEAKPIANSFAVYGNSCSTYEGYQPSGYACHYSAGSLGGVNGMWWMQLDKMTDLNFLANASWSGSTVGNVDEPASQFTADGRIAALGRNGIPEYIFISGGSNDLCRSSNGKKGNVIDLGEYTDTDVNTFRGAYNVLLQKLTKAYPNTKMICLSLFPFRYARTWVNARGWTPILCDESIKTIAAKYKNCYFVDMTQCGIKDSISAYTEDGDHPNKAGMKLLAQGLAEKLIEMGLITSTGREKIEWAEGQDAYYRIISNASDNTSAYVYPKTGNSEVSAGEYNLQYYKSNTYNTLTDEDKANPALVFHIYTRGGNDNYIIKNCGLAAKPYLEMYTKSDKWSLIGFTDTPTNKFSAFRLYDGIVYGNQAIQSVGNSTQYWRNGSAANGITTAAYNASNMDFDFTLQRIDDAQVAWAKYCEEVNTDLGLQSGTAPGYVKAECYEALMAQLKAADLTYDSSKDYVQLLKDIKEAKEAAMVEIDGLYTINFEYGTTKEYFIPEEGVLDYSTSYLKSNPKFFFDIRKQADGNYLVKNVGNTDAPYILNVSGDESWYIGCGGRSTNIQMVSTPQMYNTINYYCPGFFRVYAVGDGFAWNSGNTQVTTIASNLPYDFVRINPAEVVVKSISDYATIYSDHDLDIPSGITAYYVESVNETDHTAKLVKFTGSKIPANTGLVIKADKEGQYVFAFTTGAAALQGVNILQGSVKTAEVAEGSYGLDHKTAAGFYAISDGKCAENSAYIPSTAFSSKQTEGYTFVFGEPTAIQPVTVDEAPAVYYDIQGRRVLNPTRGLYIKNGKKVFIK